MVKAWYSLLCGSLPQHWSYAGIQCEVKSVDINDDVRQKTPIEEGQSRRISHRHQCKRGEKKRQETASVRVKWGCIGNVEHEGRPYREKRKDLCCFWGAGGVAKSTSFCLQLTAWNTNIFHPSCFNMFHLSKPDYCLERKSCNSNSSSFITSPKLCQISWKSIPRGLHLDGGNVFYLLQRAAKRYQH